ncbi:thymidylate synthase thyx [Heliomicrobium modesticaldum Ice1]|uniref:Thymidylate synthase thyx n=1 Tax=Heliobacterium modesticaldum (strain ATCC 51547 / Ice1) TaxID=498761 RepID=B0TIC9_HELMI|nr:FAD-dependent thymidylate synthase [Heliomicrobium modesticaldum]ABZ83549.1 thymidylate synthase thyx [Heliomicrobium modesticaldum Ice1]
MIIANFEATGLDRIVKWTERNQIKAIDALALKQVLNTLNISFTLEGIDRVQSTLICELKDSYVQQSQRYVTMDAGAYRLPHLEGEDRQKTEEIIGKAFQLYTKMSQLKDLNAKGRPRVENYLYGIPIEDARYILPLATQTNVSVAMSGDKLVDLFRLLNDKKYGAIFAEIRRELSALLPEALTVLLPAEYDSDAQREAIRDFHREELAKIDAENNLVLLSCFADLDMKVGFGALTSTSQKTPSQEMARFGTEAATKARAVTQRVLGYGHESIAEQARTTFGMMCSLVTYHQQLRHRLSQNYREDLAELIRDTDRPVKVPDSIRQSPFYAEFMELVEECKGWRRVIAQKYGFEKAFSLLLNCDQIKLIIATNARIDIGMLADRTCMNAQWEIRELAFKKLQLLRSLSPVLYEKALPSCVLGKCREGKLSCGRQAEVKARYLSVDR